jgi:predicted DNA-binding transcriptional regulator YafY
MIAPQAAAARKVLEAAGADSGLNLWPDRVRLLAGGPPLEPPEIEEGVFPTLQQGLLQRRCLDITYRSRSRGRVRDYRIHPLALVFREPVTYLLATIEPYQDVVHLAAHRIQHAAVTEVPACDPESGFDLDALIREGAFDYPEGDCIELELQVDDRLAYHLGEAALSPDQRIEPLQEGGARVTATVRDTARLKWWLLGLGRAVEVRAPGSLRATLRDELDQARRRYDAADSV